MILIRGGLRVGHDDTKSFNRRGMERACYSHPACCEQTQREGVPCPIAEFSSCPVPIRFHNQFPVVFSKYIRKPPANLTQVANFLSGARHRLSVVERFASVSAKGANIPPPAKSEKRSRSRTPAGRREQHSKTSRFFIRADSSSLG